MVEKRVSVRLAAIGGKQVKAELTGIGDAGKKGFGKASREMEIANAKLAKFSRRAKIAVGVMVAAAAAAGIAMVRLSYDIPRFPCEKGAADRHFIYAGQRRRLDR